MTNFLGMFLVSYCFKFAKMAEINQGCLPCIFSLTIFYVSVLFYFKFNETISPIVILGTILYIPCIICLSISGGGSTDDDLLTTDIDAPQTESAH